MITKETNEIFRGSVLIGGMEAQSVMEQRYEDNVDPLYIYQFHDKNHPKLVKARARRTMEYMQDHAPRLVDPKDIVLSELICDYHDIWIDFKLNHIPDGPFVKVLMSRFIGENERWSADELVNFMAQENTFVEQPVYLPDDFVKARTGIMITVPRFEPTLYGQPTIIQPNLTEDSTLLDLAIAGGDLESAARDPKQFKKDGDDLFREENIDVWAALADPSPISQAKMAYFRERILDWSKF